MRSLIILLPLLACDSTPQRQVRVVDEWGEPVENAEVKLAVGRPWDQRVLARASTGADGWTTIDDVGGRSVRVYVSASDPPRRHVAFGDIDFVKLAWWTQPREPQVITLLELWASAVTVPAGESIVHARQVSWEGFTSEGPQLDIPTEWRSRWPRAAWVSGFLNPGVKGDAVDLLIEVFGKRPVVVRVSMSRVSQFQRPLLLETSSLQDWPWVDLPVILRDPDGLPLTPAAQETVRRDAVLIRREDLAQHESYFLGDYHGLFGSQHRERLAIPCGTFDLQLNFLQYPGPTRRLGPLVIGPDTKALDVILPIPLRRVDLRLPGIGHDGYTLSARHPDGFNGSWSGATGEAGASLEIVLPPGPNQLQLEYTDSEREFHRVSRTVIVTPGGDQAHTWDLRPGER